MRAFYNTLAAVIFLSSFVTAQETIQIDNSNDYNNLDEDYEYNSSRKWAIGIHLGLSNNGSDTHSWARHGVSIFEKTHLSYGLNLNYSLTQHFNLRLNYFGSSIEGADNEVLDGPCSDENDIDQSIGCHLGRDWSFTSPLHELSLDLEWEPRAGKRYKSYSEEDLQEGLREGRFARVDGIIMKVDSDGEYHSLNQFKRILSPYATVGIGLAFTDPTIDYNGDDLGNNNLAANIARDQAEFSSPHIQIPYGIGLRYDLSEKFYLDLEFRSVIPTSDWLDGMYYATNAEDPRNNNDSYQFGTLRIGVRLGGDPDTDGDGIKDVDDVCPLTPGIKSLDGCPDADLDGITDKRDNCPNQAGSKKFGGCPDRDGDLVIDSEDNCPDEAGLAQFGGCPDTDGDGIVDADDKCPNEPGEAKYQGCKPLDTDGDNVIDELDSCPTVYGTANGCPDRDEDGVADNFDRCPDVKGTVYGCPDTDGDGVLDDIDKCPNTKGIAANSGCPPVKYVAPSAPVVTEEDLSFINFLMREIKFVTNSDGITVESSAKIDEAVKFANKYSSSIFQLRGFTDNKGDKSYNQRLSERRAKRVYNEMIKRGVQAERLSYAGYGEESPIATNNTAEGRRQNRRVEISVVKR